MPKNSNRHSELHTLLTQLNLTRMAEIFADVALRAAKEGLSRRPPISMSWLDRKRNSAPNDGQLAWCVLQDCPWRKPSEHWRSRDFPQACNCNWNASKAHPSWRPQRI